jgi:hypothetical protein
LPSTSAGFCFGLSFPRHSIGVQSGLQSSIFAATVFPARDSLPLGLLFFLAAGLGSSLHDGTTLGNRSEEQICFSVSRAPAAQVLSSELLSPTRKPVQLPHHFLDFVCVVIGLLQELISVIFLCYRIKKTRGFLVLIALKWLFSEHVRKVFGEIPVRT